MIQDWISAPRERTVIERERSSLEGLLAGPLADAPKMLLVSYEQRIEALNGELHDFELSQFSNATGFPVVDLRFESPEGTNLTATVAASLLVSWDALFCSFSPAYSLQTSLFLLSSSSQVMRFGIFSSSGFSDTACHDVLSSIGRHLDSFFQERSAPLFPAAIRFIKALKSATVGVSIKILQARGARPIRRIEIPQSAISTALLIPKKNTLEIEQISIFGAVVGASLESLTVATNQSTVTIAAPGFDLNGVTLGNTYQFIVNKPEVNIDQYLLRNIVPFTASRPRSMRGSVVYYGDILSPIDVEWEASQS